MSQNITYYLGAGASYNSLPVYSNFRDRFKRFSDMFNGGMTFNELDANSRREAQNLHQTLLIFLSEFEYHNTPDTIAKKLFHIGQSSGGLTLKIVKQILILFFLYEQIVIPDNNTFKNFEKERIDKRYDLLIAGLLKPIKDKLELLEQFKVLTWNYDLQLELTYSKIADKSIQDIQQFLQSYPKLNPNDNTKYDINNFSVVHLNGIAYSKVQGFGFNETDYLGTYLPHGSNLVDYILHVYKSLNANEGIPYFENLLTFAWENLDKDYEIQNNPTLEKAIEIAKQTEYLVIIGYSFPIFNSAIDSVIIKSMHRLKKVYIQSPQAEQIKKILSKAYFENKGSDFIEDVGYTNPFYVPIEWNFNDNNIGTGISFR